MDMEIQSLAEHQSRFMGAAAWTSASLWLNGWETCSASRIEAPSQSVQQRVPMLDWPLTLFKDVE
ncbi:MAG: hypothetical protein P4L90_02735 [Rhodopila sp.]|nr:hypothetical protein [Rhodopila sp.]